MQLYTTDDGYKAISATRQELKLPDGFGVVITPRNKILVVDDYDEDGEIGFGVFWEDGELLVYINSDDYQAHMDEDGPADEEIEFDTAHGPDEPMSLQNKILDEIDVAKELKATQNNIVR